MGYAISQVKAVVCRKEEYGRDGYSGKDVRLTDHHLRYPARLHHGVNPLFMALSGKKLLIDKIPAHRVLIAPLYLGVILYCGAGLLKKTDILQCMLLVGVIGGFLFSILWEAKSRYVLPYIVLLIPYMGLGISAAQTLFVNLTGYVRKRAGGLRGQSKDRLEETNDGE